MKNPARNLLLSVMLLLLVSVSAYAQRFNAIDSLNNKLNWYGIKNQSPVLFLHFDKTIYANNDNVWFTAYFLNAANYQLYKTLSLVLVKDDDRRVVMEDKFVIRNGMGFGNTFIPDTLGPGNYSFVAATNLLKNGQPDVIFTQPVTIRSNDVQDYTASLNPIDTSATAPQQNVMLLVNFINEKVPPASVPAWFYIGNASHPLFTGSVQTTNGQYIFNIPSAMLSQGNNTLHVRVKYKTEEKEISIALPARPRPAVVGFYPEGGNLVNNTQSTVGWQVKDAGGNALKLAAALYQDEKIIDTIKTDQDGLGKFLLKPSAGSNYYVKLSGVNKKDTLYKLPAAVMQGPVLTLQQAIANDTLIVNLHDEQHEKLYLLGHNYNQLFFTTGVNMNTSNKKIKVVLNDIPKGLTELTVTDSLGRPFAERTFFAHFNQRTPLTIATDKNEYTTRQKVDVKIKLDTPLPDSGLVSVACVQTDRIDPRKQMDIESYFYLKHDLEDLPVRDTYFANNETDKQFLENILLIKGWRRYKWTDVLKTKPIDTLHTFESMTFKGVVTWLGTMLTKPVTLVNLRRPLSPIGTLSNGYFEQNDNDLITEPGKKVSFIVTGKETAEYQVHLFDPYTELSKWDAAQLRPVNYSDAYRENSRNTGMTDNTIHLKEVKIKGTNDDAFENECGDYVCRYNFLNCPFHRHEPDNRAPVIGESYYIHPFSDDGATAVYTGCSPDKHAFTFKGIYAAQEFYAPDYTQVTASEPEYLSTILWKYQVPVSSLKTTELSFYTSDTSGKFKVIAQGITGKDVTYGETTFNVVKPK